MQIRLATDSDAQRWDDFISCRKEASPYHRWAWKKSIENSYKHACYYLLAENEAGDVCGVLPSVLIKPPLGTGELCSLPFCDRGEAICIDAETETRLVERACEIAESRQCGYSYRASTQPESQPENLGAGTKVRMLLDLPSSAEELLAGFKSKLRSQIRKAEKNGLVFEIGREPRFIDDFYHVFTINMRDLGSPTHSRAWFESIREQFAENMIISVVKYQGETIGAGIVLMNGSSAAIPWASTIRSFNRLSPNMLLYWSLLSYVADHGFRTFDFGRSSFGEGTFKFKQQWGAEPVALAWQSLGGNGHDAAANPSIHRKSQMRKTIESVWTRLPLPMTVLLGSRIRKYISL